MSTEESVPDASRSGAYNLREVLKLRDRVRPADCSHAFKHAGKTVHPTIGTVVKACRGLSKLQNVVVQWDEAPEPSARRVMWISELVMVREAVKPKERE